MGKAILASIELSETNRVRKSTNKKTPEQDKAVQGEIPNTKPNKVATPLPPPKIGPDRENMPHYCSKP